MKIFGVGITGLVGSRIQTLLQGSCEFTSLSSEDGINIVDPSTLGILRDDKDHSMVLLLAAKADVDGCERDKHQGENGDAYKINVLGTQNVLNAARVGGKKVIYISTDFVFGASVPKEGGFTEEDTPDPVNWYGQTKLMAEEEVKHSGLEYIIMRIAYPYRKEFSGKLDFARAIAQRLGKHEAVGAITDHIMTPTYIDDIAYALAKLVETQSTGIFHVVGSQSLTPYDAAVKIAVAKDYDQSLIAKTTRAEYFKDRAQRPFNLQINNVKIKKLGVQMRSFDEGLTEL
jgi:dTDP-4-dehydrorhamnose reductase